MGYWNLCVINPFEMSWNTNLRFCHQKKKKFLPNNSANAIETQLPFELSGKYSTYFIQQHNITYIQKKIKFYVLPPIVSQSCIKLDYNIRFYIENSMIARVIPMNSSKPLQRIDGSSFCRKGVLNIF